MSYSLVHETLQKERSHASAIASGRYCIKWDNLNINSFAGNKLHKSS